MSQDTKALLCAAIYMFGPGTVLATATYSLYPVSVMLTLVSLLAAVQLRSYKAVLVQAFVLASGDGISVLMYMPVLMLILHRRNVSWFKLTMLSFVFLIATAYFMAVDSALTCHAAEIPLTVDQLPQMLELLKVHYMAMFRNEFGYASLKPNLSLYWYFFAEMFEHFRAFFTVVISVVVYSVVVPLCVKFRYEPVLVVVVASIVIATMTPYANLVHLQVALSLLPLMTRTLKYAHFLTVSILTMYVSALVVYPLMYFLWLKGAGGNANFLYASGLAYSIGGVMLISDLCTSSLKLQLDRYIDAHPTDFNIQLRKYQAIVLR